MATMKMLVLIVGIAGFATVTVSLAVSGRNSKGRDEEKKILNLLSQMWEKERDGMLNAPPDDCRFMRLLTESIGAKQVVEIGTSNGYSGIWFCLALRNTGGKLTTFEIDPKRAELARKNFARAGVDSLVTVVIGDAHKEVSRLKGDIDLVFIDADKEGYIDYFQKLLPLVRPGGLILAHNTTDCKAALAGYVKLVTSHPDLETVILREHDRGIAVSMKKRG